MSSSSKQVSLGQSPPGSQKRPEKKKEKKPDDESSTVVEEEVKEVSDDDSEQTGSGSESESEAEDEVEHPTADMGRMDFLTLLYKVFKVELQTDKLSFGGCNPAKGNEILRKAVKDACKWGEWKEPEFSKQALLDFIQEDADETVQVGGQSCNVNFQRCSAIGVHALMALKTRYFVVPTFEYVRRRDGAVVKMTNMRPGVKCCTIQGWAALGFRPPMTALSQKAIWLCVVRSIMKMDAFRGHGLVGTVRKAVEDEGNTFKSIKELPAFGISVNGESRNVSEGEDLGLKSF